MARNRMQILIKTWNRTEHKHANLSQLSNQRVFTSLTLLLVTLQATPTAKAIKQLFMLIQRYRCSDRKQQ